MTRHSDGWQQFPGVLRSPSWKWRKERKGAETVMNYERGRKGRQGNSKGYVIFIQRLQSLGHHSFIIDTFPINFSTVLEECRTVHCNAEHSCTYFLWKKHFFLLSVHKFFNWTTTVLIIWITYVNKTFQTIEIYSCDTGKLSCMTQMQQGKLLVKSKISLRLQTSKCTQKKRKIVQTWPKIFCYLRTDVNWEAISKCF